MKSMYLIINADHLHEYNILQTLEMDVPSTVNTLKKIGIARDLYEKYVSNYYYDRRVESYNPEFNFFQTAS